MITMKRKSGISVLIASQNEEATIATSIHSFLDFGDELIVVDNGSTDCTKDIVRALVAEHPEKIRFFDRPDLPDLYHNRQFALEQSRFRWIVRGDADFIAYTSGLWNISEVRDYLKEGRRMFPPAIAVPLVNVSIDYWHTGLAQCPAAMSANMDRSYIAPPVTGPRLRLYRFIPGFRFKRCGRWEATTYHLLYRSLAKVWTHPIWMHCSIKPALHHFFRSERTNWREQGDFARFPTLRSYIEHIVEDKYGTRDLDEAAALYMSQQVYPYLQHYDEEVHGPYPELVRDLMRTNPIYRVVDRDGQKGRIQIDQGK